MAIAKNTTHGHHDRQPWPAEVVDRAAFDALFVMPALHVFMHGGHASRGQIAHLCGMGL